LHDALILDALIQKHNECDNDESDDEENADKWMIKVDGVSVDDMGS
jgi:hypothetical protein